MKKLKSGGFTAAACLLIAFGGAPSVFGNCCILAHTVEFSVPGATQTVPTSINSSGAVAGYYVAARSWWSLIGCSCGFVRDPNGTITTFTGPGGGAILYMGVPFAVLINDSGVVAGTYSDQSYVQHGFVGDPKVAGGLASFDPPGSILTQVTGINAWGSVTGYFYDANYVTHGFVYYNGTAYAFDPPPGLLTNGAHDTYASAITDMSDVIGFYYDQNGNTVGFWCGIICSHSGPWFYFGPPAGFSFQSFFYARTPNPPGNRPRLVVTGTLYDGIKASYAGYVANFGTGALVSYASFQYPGASNTYPYGINTSGEVVGGYADSNFNWHAFVRESNGVLENADPPGANGDAWANAVNDSFAITGPPVGSLGFITFP